MSVGYIHSIETLGTVDNGGIRFVLFLQGCALHCRFCHNPDTWLKKGKQVTVTEIVEQLQDYKPFFDLSGGGLTVSGGEPLLQPEFVRDLFIKAGELEIHRALDTSGFCRHGNILTVLPHTDLVIFSVKAVDEKKHRELTGAGNEEIMKNLNLVVQSKTEVVICYVLIPTVNDSSADLQDFVALVKSFPRAVPVQILPYNKLGTIKWKEMGLCDPLAGIPPATQDEINAFQEQLRSAGIQIY
jgi:pyruvate formate lyase activating enzyme